MQQQQQQQQRLARLFRSVLTRNIGKLASFAFPANMSTRSRFFANPYPDEDGDADAATFSLDRVSAAAKEDLRQTLERIVKKEPAASADIEGGLYVGSAGIAYAFLHASERLSADEAAERLSLAELYLEPSLRDLEKRGSRADRGFLLGAEGIVAVAAVVAHKRGDNERSDKLAKRYASTDFFHLPSDEFFVGRAGYLLGALWLNKQLGRPVVHDNVMRECARAILASGKTYARKHNSPCPLMYAYYDTEYLGAAHGLAAILQALIQVPGFLEKDEEAAKLVRDSVDYFLSVETSSGNYPCAVDEIGSRGRRDESNELVHWCHGAPGVVYLFATAFLRWKDPRYLDACRRAADLVWRKGLLKKGPGICHGVAGNGYVFLLLHRLTSEVRYLRRAARFADFLNTDEFKRDARTPDCPYSLYEGIAGTACFLADLTRPGDAAFPFQDVF